MVFAIAVAVYVLALGINISALRASHEPNRSIRVLARISGGVGMFCVLGLLVAIVDAFSQIWVKRPGYEAQPVFVFFYAAAVSTVVSMAMIVAAIIRDFRLRRRNRS